MLDLLLNLLFLCVAGLSLFLMRGRSPLFAAPAQLLFAGAAGGMLAMLVSGGFGFMRAWAWLLFAHAPIWLTIAASRAALARSRLEAGLLSAAALVLIGIGADAFLIEPHAIEVTRYRVESSEIGEPVRVVVLTDIQTDHIGEYEQRVFALAAAERPDLVLLPGDYLQILPWEEQRYREEVAAFRALLPSLQARLGVYAVRGNSEHRQSWRVDLFEGSHVQASERTATARVGPLTLSALSFYDGFDKTAELAHVDGFHLAFAHSPDFSLSSGVDADLLIAGHTHGGQVQLPLIGPLMTLSAVPRRHAGGGMFPLPGGRTLVVSRGIGMERNYAPRLRFLCRPEIVVIDIVPSGTVPGDQG